MPHPAKSFSGLNAAESGIVRDMTEGRILATMVLAVALAPALSAAQTCERLAQLGSATVAIDLAKSIDSGPYKPGKITIYPNLPAFCRVQATLKPTGDSVIGVEIWLPSSTWNGKFMAIGSGGWGGFIAYEGMADALRRGYATSATNDGHTTPGASFIVGHPEKFIDFAYRAEHEMAVEAKILIKAYYGRDPRYSYWLGCSGGGREALLQAYRFPNEFDGIIAGDPANIRRNAWALWLANQTFKDPASYIPPAKYPLIHRFVLDACDANDGLKDGLIEDPESCHVDFKGLECKSSDQSNCLTSAQVKTAQTLLSPATTSTGKVVFPGYAPGSELGWDRLAGGPKPGDLFLDEYRYVVYHDPDWDWRSFDLERDSAKADAADKGIDDLDPHLAPFVQHGGKLLIYHGWADQQVAPGSSVDFYRSAVQLSGDPAQASNAIRLYMAPGMGHCGGGEGPDTFDKIGVLEQWVEQGKAPDAIVASHSTAGQVDRTRPLCPYPQIAHYKGSGSIDEAANFTCGPPR
jgi:feruloyl esterase